MKTFHLPGEPAPDETLRLPAVIRLQRGIYLVLGFFYTHFYLLLMWLGLLAVYFSVQRKPELIWWTIAAIALSRIFIPDIIGKADWRYTLGGMVLVQADTVLWLVSLIQGLGKLILGRK